MATNEMKSTQAFQDCIRQYLDNRAENDELFAVKYANPSKTIEQCAQYVMQEVKRMGVCGLADEDVWSLCVHFYEEPEIEVGEPINCHVVELTDEEKAEARQKAIEQLQREEADRLRRKAERPKVQPQQVQPSLFDF